MRSATSQLRVRVSNLYALVGGVAIVWSLSARLTQQSLAGISDISIIGGVVVVILAALIRRNVDWARDILLIASSLMTLLSLATLLGGLTFLWLMIGVASGYLTWGLLKL